MAAWIARRVWCATTLRRRTHGTLRDSGTSLFAHGMTDTREQTFSAIRPATLDDLQALTEIYNYYVVNTTITFDLHPFTAAEGGPWFEDHEPSGPPRLLVATDGSGACIGYAATSR